MRVLLDEMLPVGVAALLPDHVVTTVKAAGFTGLNNGELIRRAVLARYEVLLTADRNLPEQQNIRVSGLAVLLVPGNRLAEIAPDGSGGVVIALNLRSGEDPRLPMLADLMLCTGR